jgi:hypothetical protein
VQPQPAPSLSPYPSPPPAYPPPYPYPPPPPSHPHRGLRVALATLLAVAALCGLGDGALAVLRANLRPEAGSAYFFGDAKARDAALNALLDRREAAVAGHHEAAFLADIDQNDPSFTRHQQQEYQNLHTLDLASFTLTVSGFGEYPIPNDQAALARRYEGRLWAVPVTVRYAVRGLDKAPVAEPWVPLFGFAGGRWLLAGESDQEDLPTGAGGLPWEADRVVVKRSAHVVAVVSADQQEIAPHLLDLAERGLTEVFRLRSSGWAGKVLVTAVSDRKVFQSYFRDSPDRAREVAAIAVPTYDNVREWSRRVRYVTTRVVFNPLALGDGDDVLMHELAHEFTHAAMGPLTNPDATPLWLVEGIAEYVAYSTREVSDVAIGGELRRVTVPKSLPADSTFYDSADNYLLAWLASRQIAQKYGQSKLIALYSYFGGAGTSVDSALRAVLGVTLDQFTAQWHAHLNSLLA